MRLRAWRRRADESGAIPSATTGSSAAAAAAVVYLLTAYAILGSTPTAAAARRRHPWAEMGTQEIHVENGTLGKTDDKEALDLKGALEFFDANFFNDSKVQEMAKGAKAFNIPAFRVDRKLVASEDGGLHNPSVLVFNSDWGRNEGRRRSWKSNYPFVTGVRKSNYPFEIPTAGLEGQTVLPVVGIFYQEDEILNPTSVTIGVELDDLNILIDEGHAEEVDRNDLRNLPNGSVLEYKEHEDNDEDDFDYSSVESMELDD